MRERIVGHPRETAAALLALVLGAAVFQYAQGLPDMQQGPGPGLFPTIIGVLFGVFGVVLFAQVAMGKVPPIEVDTIERESRRRAIANILVVVAAVPLYVFLSDLLGFVITASAIAIGVMAWLRARLRIAAPIAILVAVLVNYLFGTILRVPLPSGPLGW